MVWNNPFLDENKKTFRMFHFQSEAMCEAYTCQGLYEKWKEGHLLKSKSNEQLHVSQLIR